MTTVCRSCGAPLVHTFVDLGTSPLANSYVRLHQAHRAEAFYPLHAYVCNRCFLVQIPECEKAEFLFTDYAYFSSYSDSWVEHSRQYVEAIIPRLGLGPKSYVVEIASNDGYLLQHFLPRGIPVLGIEPAANVAEAAEERGVPTVVRFFDERYGRELASLGQHADLIIGNNVLAHVPNLNGFVAGMEFPHLMRLMEGHEFDTIYHEHFSYFSLLSVERVFARHRLTIYDVEELPTHGGSLRIHVSHTGHEAPAVGSRVADLLRREREAGLDRIDSYRAFGETAREAKRALLAFLIEAKRRGKRVVGYGAPAKGNTLLNYCGVRTDFLDYTVDRNPHKQGCLLPGTRIPIHAPEKIQETKPDYVLILPWNLKDEITKQMAHIRSWGGQFVVPIPQVEVLA
jgi:hypothetical protein